MSVQPIQVPLGVMQSLHRLQAAAYDPARNEPISFEAVQALYRLEALAYDPAHNDQAGDDYAWADQPTPGRGDQLGRILGNLALIIAVMLAAMMLGGFSWALVAGRVQ
jgi:hypothetical protein